jgi:hypothetical protein
VSTQSITELQSPQLRDSVYQTGQKVSALPCSSRKEIKEKKVLWIIIFIYHEKLFSQKFLSKLGEFPARCCRILKKLLLKEAKDFR